MPPAGFLWVAHFSTFQSPAVSLVLTLLSVNGVSKLTLPSVRDEGHATVGETGI